MGDGCPERNRKGDRGMVGEPSLYALSWLEPAFLPFRRMHKQREEVSFTDGVCCV